MVKTGKETILEDEETGKPVIVEDLCSGCGICVKKCPHDAIQIINIVEEVGEPIHQYGVNGFRLYNLPTPKEGVVGVIGANGIGKTTMMRILSGELKPNLGKDGSGWGEVVERFRGKEIQNYLEMLSRREIKAAYKLSTLTKSQTMSKDGSETSSVRRIQAAGWTTSLKNLTLGMQWMQT